MSDRLAETNEWLAALKADIERAKGALNVLKDWSKFDAERGTGSMASRAKEVADKSPMMHSARASDHRELAAAHMDQANKLARNAGSLVQSGNAELGQKVLDRANDHERAANAHEEAARAHTAAGGFDTDKSKLATGAAEKLDAAKTATARAAELSAIADKPAL